MAKKANSTTLCAVDMGSNSFHMVLVKADSETGRMVVVDQMKEEVRLLTGTGKFNVIMEGPQDRAISVLKRLRKIAVSKNAGIRLVATSAVREARNSNAFIRRVQKETGLNVEVISGLEEARLVYLGAMQALPIFDKNVMLVDIGGGSTEILLGRAGKPRFAISLKLGHLRLYEAFFGSPETCEEGEAGSDGVVDGDSLRECRRTVRLCLEESAIKDEILDMIRSDPIDFAVGSSGTIERIETMIHAQRQRKGRGAKGGDAEAGEGASDSKSDKDTGKLDERKFDLSEVKALVKKICACKTRKERAALPGINDKRVDLIVTGALILEEVMAYLSLDVMKVSPFALREGVVVDSLSRSIKGYKPAPDIRRDSVMHLATRFDTENRLRSAKHSVELAKQLVSSLRESEDAPLALHVLDRKSEFLLESAILLHSVGMFVNHSKHHKHSYYIIKNSDMLLGFMPVEIEMLALLALFHTKKHPSARKHAQFAKLPEELQERIVVMTSIIRLAIALDRRNTACTVESVSVLQDGKGCVLVVTPGIDAQGAIHDVSFEIWAAKQELPYFAKVFGRSASIIEGDRREQIVNNGTESSISS